MDILLFYFVQTLHLFLMGAVQSNIRGMFFRDWANGCQRYSLTACSSGGGGGAFCILTIFYVSEECTMIRIFQHVSIIKRWEARPPG